MRIEAEKVVLLPEGKTDWYELDRNVGMETFYIVASQSPLPALEQQALPWTSKTRGSVEPPDVQGLVKALEETKRAHEVTTRGLAGVKKGLPVRIQLPDGKEVERLGAQFSEPGVVIRKLEFEHR